MDKKTTKVFKFEDAMKRLEEVVDEMENSQVNLDKSLELFEEGVKLVKLCSAKLEESKKKIEILVKKGSSLTPEPFKAQSDDESSSTNGGDLL